MTGMTDLPMRAWCGRYQWPGKKPFLFGTVLVRAKGPQHEVEAEMLAEFDRRWGEILPDNTPRPTLIHLVPGSIFFVPEETVNAAAS